MAKGLTVGASRYARRLFEFSHFFFFSSRRRHTRSKRDWSSDVCSSDLQLNESLVIYHVSDKYDANTMDHATDPAYIRKLHERAIAAADLVFYSSRKLFNEASGAPEKSFLLEQAVDFDHWAPIGNGSISAADAVERIPRPRIGYFGAIEPWLIDQELIRQAARERPEWNWIFIGNKSRGLEIERLA